RYLISRLHPSKKKARNDVESSSSTTTTLLLPRIRLVIRSRNQSNARTHERPPTVGRWGSSTSSGTRRWPARCRTPASASSATTTPKGDSWRRLRRKPRTADAAVPEAAATVGPRSPTVYDWWVTLPWIYAQSMELLNLQVHGTTLLKEKSECTRIRMGWVPLWTVLVESLYHLHKRCSMILFSLVGIHRTKKIARKRSYLCH
uniref:Uncharacterized protein n=1 Tax=Oryza brachyantha TaxID=4533 RepID=J3MTJ5_ORYBR